MNTYAVFTRLFKGTMFDTYLVRANTPEAAVAWLKVNALNENIEVVRVETPPYVVLPEPYIYSYLGAVVPVVDGDRVWTPKVEEPEPLDEVPFLV